ncbi:UDP-N-acetylmuramoyl-L-alanine--D-glutamate ligase [Eubacteriaceae bacterium ES2]|nr:UDP-N-acetylmuramoyl-L-alanine--D-glutamate ligase [Eubacteriaceae bacterium ES2]
MHNKYLIIGAARSGVAVAKLLLERGETVILSDSREEMVILKSFPQIKKFANHPRFESIFGGQPQLTILETVKEIIISPGVPLTIPVIEAARAQDIVVTGEVELAYRLTDTPFLAITGTNGKTTTTTLLGEIFKASGKETYVVGNIGDPISNYVQAATKDDVFVTEISSFQLETIKDFRPAAAAILNITPDHLDRHLTMANYIAAKARVFENQKADDLLILNADDDLVRQLGDQAVAKKVWFSYRKMDKIGVYCQDGIIYINDENGCRQVMAEKELGIIGPHNTMNAMAALAIAYFKGLDLATVVAVLKAFKGVTHRLEYVGQYAGVTYINDSKGTNTSATITAINAFDGPIILLAGGYDKKEDYQELMELIKKRVKKMIVLGATADHLIQAAEAVGFREYQKVTDYNEAVAVAKACSEADDTVLLSPACASWDMFENFEIRGETFKQLVREMNN